MNKPRKRYPSVRHPRKTVFTPAIWVRWMTEHGWTTSPPDQTLQLRAGIAEFRHRLRLGSDPEART
jgi:hypothetical protein